MNAAAAEAIGTPLPTLIDITTVPSEAEIPCRTASALPFVGNGGIFLSVSKSSMNIPNPRGGAAIELITVHLKLNTAHRIKPGAAVPNCNMDGVTYLPAKSINVQTVAEPQYIRSGAAIYPERGRPGQSECGYQRKALLHSREQGAAGYTRYPCEIRGRCRSDTQF